MTTSPKTAIVGLGSMGYGMAQSCLRAQHKVYGYDVVQDQMDRFKSEGGKSDALSDIAAELDGAMIVVLNAAQTEAVLFGADGLVSKMKKGAVVAACATVAPEFARDMEKRCLAFGVHYLDAPISGGSAKAASGLLSVMASGTAEAFHAARPMLDATAETVFELGETAGAGSAMKPVNQLLAGVTSRRWLKL